MGFIKTFFLTILLFGGLCAGLIISVDPYEKLGINIWNFKTKAVAQGRENKYQEFENSKIKYEAFILGSSAAHRYPTQKLKELTGLESYNYAVQHTTPDDYLAITRHILSKAKPKLIILQSDFTDLDKNFAVDNRLHNSSLNQFLDPQAKKNNSLFTNTYFTLKALNDSLKVFYVNWFGKAAHTYLKHGNYKKEKVVKKAVKLQQSDYRHYDLSQQRIEKMKELQQIALDNHIRLIVLTAPLSYEHFLLIENKEHNKVKHQEYLQAMKSVFKELYNFEHESIKNYSDYRFFHNSTHPTKELSILVLERILTDKHVSLGEKY